METYKPTLSEINEAKSYILQRISNQNALEEILSDEFRRAAEKIVLIILKYKNRRTRLHFTGSSAMAAEIQEVIDDLEAQIDYYVEYYCVPEEAEDDPDVVAGIVYRTTEEPDHDYTYQDRKTLYLSNYIKALEGFDFSDYDDEDTLLEAIEEATEKPSNRMLILGLGSVALGFGFYALQQALSNGKTGFVSYVNSSNPCKFCESVNGVVQPIENYPEGSYHPRCCCWFIFV